MRALVIKSLGLCVLMGIAFCVRAECGPVLESMTEDAILKRIKPVGKVEVAGGGPAPVAAAPAALPANAGELRYKSTCSICHQAGIGGAPKFRDAADWKPRMAVGMDGMLKIAIEGKGAMPPKGTCMQCSDEELKKTIEYMLPQ